MPGRILSMVVCSFVLILLPEARAMAADEPFDINRIGPQVGEAVPGFELPDQAGVSRTLKSLMGPRGLVLVFFRSADW